MAVNWCQHVDGVTIFPKLPVYLRTHHTAWTRNQRVKEAVRKAAPGEAVLVHRHLVHGVAPWGEQASGSPDGRMIAYIRPEFPTIAAWLDAP